MKEALLPYPAAPKLSLKAVTKRFAGREVLRNIDVEVAAGRSLVIIGGSGQGKSVTLKIAAGLLNPDTGKVLYDGKDVTHLGRGGHAKLASRYGFLFQGAALFDSLRVWENVAFRLVSADRTPRREAYQRALEAMDSVGLSPKVARLRPSEISGGMQKRVGLARAIVSHPEVLFFDEPTTGLDPITAGVINELIVREVRRLGATAISITHDMASARTIADEIAMLHDGAIVWRGPAAEIDRSDNPYVDQFVNGRTEGPIKGAV